MTASPEWNLLLSCARFCHGDGRTHAEVPANLPQALDWTALLKTASRHGLTAQLDRYLQNHPELDAPAAVLSRLKLQSRINLARNQQLVEELAALLTLFGAHDIPAMPYKGPALAVTVYGDLTLRACGDLDILLRPADVLRAKALLLGQGFQPVQQFRDGQEEAQHLQADCEYNFHRASDGLLVELHWRFRPQFFPLPIDLGRLWASALPVILGGAATLTLAPEDLLLILCVHGTKHRWERMGWVCDIAEVLRAYPGLSWGKTWAQAKALGCGRVLLLGLALANELLGTPLPEAAPRKMPAAVTALTAQVRRQLVQEGESGMHNSRARMLFHLRVRDRLRDRIPYVKHHWQRRIEERKA